MTVTKKKKKTKKVAKKRPVKTDERITNWRSAHRAGKVWVNVKINGGDVGLDEHPIGTMQMEGPKSPVQGLIIWMAACGRSLKEIKAFLKENGYKE